MSQPNQAAPVCPTCGTQCEPAARFCPKDGTALGLAGNQSLIDKVVGGRYHIHERLGAGGMGQVYRATHLSMKRPCAFKVLQAKLEWDADALARFQREAENASRINHANIAQVYDSGESDGITFLAMEYIEGETLSDTLEREKVLSPRRTARIVWQVANGLTAAHELGIAHRDLKPANIMLTKYRQWSDFVKVVDFGIAKTTTGPGQEVTSVSAIIGTPEYMAPEQFASPAPDIRSDVYSLAMVAVRCLAGKLPPNVGLASLVPSADPTDRVGLLSMAEVVRWPDSIKAVLVKGLALDPRARYQTAEEFSADFVTAASAWEPAAAGTREPWEGRVPAAGGARAVRPETGRRRLVVAVGGAVLLGFATVMLLRGRGGVLPAEPAAGAPVPPPVSPTAPLSDPPPTDTAVPTTPPRSVESVPDSLTLLERLTEVGRMDNQSAARAVNLYRYLRGRVSAEETRIVIAVHAANAYIQLGRQGEACRVLGAIRAAAGRSTETAGEQARALLAGC